MTVMALTDRGLESARLFRAIQEAGFHPLMRLKQGAATFRPQGWTRFHPLRSLARPGRFCAAGELYKTDPLPCTLLIRHDQGHADPWILATDCPAAGAAWYALRSWTEQGFKDLKRGGFQWQHTRMSDPARVERIWMALALALLWTLEVAAALEALDVGSPLPPESRRHSLSVRGRIAILASLIAGPLQALRRQMIAEPPPLPSDPWPPHLPPPPPMTEQDLEHRQNTYT